MSSVLALVSSVFMVCPLFNLVCCMLCWRVVCEKKRTRATAQCLPSSSGGVGRHAHHSMPLASVVSMRLLPYLLPVCLSLPSPPPTTVGRCHGCADVPAKALHRTGSKKYFQAQRGFGRRAHLSMPLAVWAEAILLLTAYVSLASAITTPHPSGQLLCWWRRSSRRCGQNWTSNMPLSSSGGWHRLPASMAICRT